MEKLFTATASTSTEEIDTKELHNAGYGPSQGLLQKEVPLEVSQCPDSKVCALFSLFSFRFSLFLANSLRWQVPGPVDELTSRCCPLTRCRHFSFDRRSKGII
ncbi:hypothetical protein ACLKA6_003074 [Drosophila palustris]